LVVMPTPVWNVPAQQTWQEALVGMPTPVW
jgi:hypothetical protein